MKRRQYKGKAQTVKVIGRRPSRDHDFLDLYSYRITSPCFTEDKGLGEGDILLKLFPKLRKITENEEANEVVLEISVRPIERRTY